MKTKLFMALMVSCGAVFAITTPTSTSVAKKIQKNDLTCEIGNPKSSNYYLALKWYSTSAEKKAIYSEVFTLGLEKVKAHVQTQHLKPEAWGAVFDIDETLLDNMQYTKDYLISKCEPFDHKSWNEFINKEVSVATPGATKITCAIQKSGGKVVLVTNRTWDLVKPTLANLNKVGICYDTVIFAKDAKDWNKTPRFNAVIKGDYKEVLASKKDLPALNVVAYFGDNIQDFPNTTQASALAQKPDSDFYKHFGEEYFSLPNPNYGSWMKNHLFP